MSLPSPWVEKIFTKLTLVYGRNFLDRWTGLDMDAVKDDWAHELSALQQSPRAITYALQNLPADKPPTVLEFRKIAWSTPAADMPKIEHQPANPLIVAKALSGLAPNYGDPFSVYGMKTWMHRLRVKDEANPRSVTPTIRMMYKSALGEVAA